MAVNLAGLFNPLKSQLNPAGALNTTTPSPVAPSYQEDYMNKLNSHVNKIQNDIDTHASNQTASILPVFDYSNLAPTQSQLGTEQAPPVPYVSQEAKTQNEAEVSAMQQETPTEAQSSMVSEASASELPMDERIKSFSKEIKDKYPEYQSVDDYELVDAMLKKYPEYNALFKEADNSQVVTAPIPEESLSDKFKIGSSESFAPVELAKDVGKFFVNIPADSAEIVGGLWDAVNSPVETTKGIVKTAKGLSDKAVYTLGNSIVRQLGGKEVSPTEEAEMIDAIAGHIKQEYGTPGKFKKAMVENPADTLLNLMGGLGAVSKVAETAGLTNVVSNIEKVQSVINPVNVLKKEAQLVGAIGKGTVKAIGKTGEFVTNQVSGLAPETRAVLKDMPSIYGEAKSGELTARSTIEDYAQALKDRSKSLSELGSGYDELVKGENVANKSQIEDIWLNRTEKANTKNMTDEDLATIKKVGEYVDRRNSGALTDEDLIGLRRQIKSTLDSDVRVSSYGKKLVNGMVSDMDRLIEEKVPGYKELNKAYATEKQFLDKAIGEIVDKNGAIKDGALGKLSSIMRENKDIVRDRFENIMPGITDKVKALNALDDVRNASTKKVGTYFKGALGGTLVASNPILGLSVMAATNPWVIANVLERYGLAKQAVKSIISKLVSKTVNPIESETISKAVKSIPEKEMQQIILNAEESTSIPVPKTLMPAKKVKVPVKKPSSKIDYRNLLEEAQRNFDMTKDAKAKQGFQKMIDFLNEELSVKK